MRHAATIAAVITLAGTAAASEPAARSLVPTRSAGTLYINLATGERSLTLYNTAEPVEIDAVNTAALFDYWMSVDENPCWDDARADGFGLELEQGGDGTTGFTVEPVVAWDYGDLPYDSIISGLQIKVATTATDDIDSNGDGTLDSGIDSVSVFYDGLSDAARSSNTPPTAVIRVESIPGIAAADAGDTEIPDFDLIIDFGGDHFELGDSDGFNHGALYLPGAAPGKDISETISSCTTSVTSGGNTVTNCTPIPNPNADGLADFQYLQYYTQHGTHDKVTSASTFISLGTPEGTIEFTTYTYTTTPPSCGGPATDCTLTVTVISTYLTADPLPQGQEARESFGLGSLASYGSLDDIDPVGTKGCCYWFGGLDCAGFLAQLEEEPQFNATYYNFIPYAQLSVVLFSCVDCTGDVCLTIDFNGDFALDNGDIGAFINLFLQQDPTADINGDGILDNGDIGGFIALFLDCAG